MDDNTANQANPTILSQIVSICGIPNIKDETVYLALCY